MRAKSLLHALNTFRLLFRYKGFTGKYTTCKVYKTYPRNLNGVFFLALTNENFDDITFCFFMLVWANSQFVSYKSFIMLKTIFHKQAEWVSEIFVPLLIKIHISVWCDYILFLTLGKSSCVTGKNLNLQKMQLL